MHIEPLEARIAPATLFALSEANQLLRFDSATPGTIDATLSLTGLGAGETLRGIDFRPETSELFAISVATGSANNSTVRTYLVNTTTGALTIVGQTAAAIPGAGDVPTGFDFNPTVDRMRYVNTNDENARLNPNNGALAGDDTDISPAATVALIGVAYDRNFANTPQTTLFAIDRDGSTLSRIGGVDGTPSPNGGTVTEVGELGITLSPTRDGGFDIENATGTAYAALTTDNNITRLYAINLFVGTATSLGNIGTGAGEIRSLAVAPTQAVTFVNDKTVTYLDPEGDLVTVKITKGTLDAGNFKLAFKEGGRLELHQLDLSAAEFNLTDVSILAKKTRAGGDGTAVVGRIGATAVDLGRVTVGGDLAQIDAGDGDPGKPALASLSVHSLGVANVSARLFDLISTLDGALGSLTVKKDVQGATVNVTGDIGKVTIGGSLAGSASPDSGALIASGNIGPVKIGGSLLGSTGTRSGAVEAGGTLTSISIGGLLRGDIGTGSGGIKAGSIGKVTIRGDAVGGTGDFSGSVLASGDGGLGDVTLGGSLYATVNTKAGIFSEGPLGAVKIGGEVRGLGSVPVRISAEGNLNPADLKAALAIKSITVGRSVTNALMLGGYSSAGVATNPDAQIGTVTVKGDWTTSSLVTGATTGTDTLFGNANDASVSDGAGDGVVARIAKIVIKGSVAGTYASPFDHFGFVAHEIGSLMIGGRKVPLTAGAGNDDLTASNPLLLLATTGDLRVREVAL